jgi:hypothetical protein
MGTAPSISCNVVVVTSMIVFMMTIRCVTVQKEGTRLRLLTVMTCRVTNLISPVLQICRSIHTMKDNNQTTTPMHQECILLPYIFIRRHICVSRATLKILWVHGGDEFMQNVFGITECQRQSQTRCTMCCTEAHCKYVVI